MQTEREADPIFPTAEEWDAWLNDASRRPQLIGQVIDALVAGPLDSVSGDQLKENENG